MDDATANRLRPHQIAMLRGGRRAAVKVAVLALHLRGSVGAGPGGTARTTGPVGDARDLPALTRAVHSALYRPAGTGQLPARRSVATALAGLRRELVAAGLLRRFPPGRTRHGRRALRTLRRLHPLPAAAEGVTPEDRLYAVALYGDRALTALVPRFARDAGLLGRGGTTERELRQSWGSGGGSGGFTCGSV
ncbi:TIGR04222 domain-containing membrane protein [Streptomyces sp. NPDC004065]|uniref:TIGR04222 domain-containing membrane protein n=1 Tax=Streptomyces sp. NPDC004065 TaxID=3364689 RepID=UPI00384EC58E